jgi:hypothetical protein
MEHGFTREHFDLLAEWDGVAREAGDADQDQAYTTLVDAYEATARWAYAVQERLFSDGFVRKLSKPTDQGQKFKPYTWSRIFPRKTAPTNLAYTVGIDAVGEFCVKIDTVNQGGAPRRRYEELSRHDNRLVGGSRKPFRFVLVAGSGACAVTNSSMIVSTSFFLDAIRSISMFLCLRLGGLLTDLLK